MTLSAETCRGTGVARRWLSSPKLLRLSTRAVSVKTLESHPADAHDAQRPKLEQVLMEKPMSSTEPVVKGCDHEPVWCVSDASTCSGVKWEKAFQVTGKTELDIKMS